MDDETINDLRERWRLQVVESVYANAIKATVEGFAVVETQIAKLVAERQSAEIH